MADTLNIHIDATPAQIVAIRKQAEKLGIPVNELVSGNKLLSIPVKLYVTQKFVNQELGSYFSATIHDPTYSRTVWKVEELRRLPAP